MPDTQRAHKLLALFTSAECAEGIAGDLAEGRDGRGSIWFWRQVLTTIAALCVSTLTRAPLGTLGLATAGCWLFASSALASVAAVSLFPPFIGSALSWIVLSSIWWSGALFTGVSLVSIGQVRGMAACVLLAIFSEALLVAFGLSILPSRILGSRSVVFYSIAALATVPLLAGGAIVRLRPTPQGAHIPEQ